MRRRVVYFIVVFATICLIAADCGNPPPPPTPTPQQVTGSITPYNNKTELEVDQPATFEIGIIPTDAKAKVASVNVYPDGMISGTCTQSDKSMFTWYCTPAKESPVGMILADIKGDFPDIQAKYPVKVVASAQTSHSTSAATRTSSGIGSTPTPIIVPSVAPATTEPPATDSICSVPICGPKQDEEVARITQVTGSLTKPLQAGESLWLVIIPGGTDTFHPQPGLIVRNDNTWSVTANIGIEKDAGLPFTLIVGITNGEMDQEFNKYLSDAAINKDWPGIPLPLPTGFTRIDDVIVIRK
jgi:hypothetical protein